MIKYIWLITLILYSSVVAQEKNKPDATLKNSTTAQPNASAFSARLRFPSFNQLSSSAQTRSAASRSNFIAQSQRWTQQVRQRNIIEQACMNSSIAQITDFFEQCRSQGIFSDEQLLAWYSLYKSSSYRTYVKRLPGYEHHVTELHRALSGNNKTRKKGAKQMGLTLESAQKLVDHLWTELQQDRATREAHEKMQQAAQEALHAQQEQLLSIKAAQQQVLLAQAPLLEHCITQWKTQAQNCTDDISARYTRRIRVANLDHWKEQSYTISTDVNTLLTQHKIAPDLYMTLYGNELQHTLHGEFLSILNHVALNNKQNIFDTFVQKLYRCTVECTDSGCAYNKQGATAHASMIADIGWNILDLASAVTEAIHDATISTADLVTHPLETLCAIRRSVFYFVASTGDGLLYKDTDYQYVPESSTLIPATYNAIGRELLETAYQMKARDWVKTTVCFATECLLQAKLLKTLSCACKGAGNYALRCAQIIESSLPEAKVAVAGAESITAGGTELGETVVHAITQEGKLFNLIKQVDGTYRSPAGLIYGPDKKFGNSVYHVLEHIKEVIGKKKHTVFNVTGEELFLLIDEAWLKKGLPLPHDICAYIIELDRVIGTAGEKAIKIVVIPGTFNIVTAYPI